MAQNAWDGCAGFSPKDASADPWLPQPAGWREHTVAVLSGNPDSILELYRQALHLRRDHPALGEGGLRWLDGPQGTLSFARDPGFICMVNLSDRPLSLPPATQVLLASGPLTAGREIPPDTAVWLGSHRLE